MEIKIHTSWKAHLAPIFQSGTFKQLRNFVKKEYQNNTCYPHGKEIFAAFDYCPFEDVKVVILGQDPYHGAGQANGLCFSVREGVPHPPSLINIFKEVAADIGTPPPLSGDLSRWAEQGVLLLNATLTVKAHQAGSHQGKGWEEFTDTVISKLSDERAGIVFLLWGGFAKKKSKLIDSSKHYILESGHPSPLSANRGYWFGNKHFSKTNQILKQEGEKAINW